MANIFRRGQAESAGDSEKPEVAAGAEAAAPAAAPDLASFDLDGLRQLVDVLTGQKHEIERELLPAAEAAAKAAFERGDGDGVAAAFARRAELQARQERLVGDIVRVDGEMATRTEPARQAWSRRLAEIEGAGREADEGAVRGVEAAVAALEVAVAGLAAVPERRAARARQVADEWEKVRAATAPHPPYAPRLEFFDLAPARNAAAARLVAVLDTLGYNVRPVERPHHLFG